jgi:histone acetyltransferase (RNA polymerase elongator complex component)
MKEKHLIIPIFIPHKGCPFDCIYCNQRSISGQVEEMTEVKMRSIIEEHLKFVEKDTFVELGFYGGSFTGIEKEQQIHFLKIANEYIINNKIREIRLSTRPDYIDEVILEYLKYYKVKTIELGVQSLDDSVLKQSHRGHKAETVYRSSKLIKEAGLNLGIQTMIGLPGDSFERDLYTAKQVIALKPKIVRIYPTLVIKGTYLEELFYKTEYVPLSLSQAVEICATLLKLYEENNIKVIRLGLQPTDTINTGMDVVAGPFHPAFRQLVESKLALSKIESIIVDRKLSDNFEVTICTGSRNISNVIGQKRENICYLKEKYGFKKINVVENNELELNVSLF